jgi:hypothetical protein
MTDYIHGIHDPNGKDLMGNRPGWIVFTEAIGSNPADHSGVDYSSYEREGFSVIVRLNNGYSPVGTIPGFRDYDAFARRCGNFVAASPGIKIAIVGNEPNHLNERPYGAYITPNQYAECFDLCYKQIKNKANHVQVACAAVAPWDATTNYQGNASGDWIEYYRDMILLITKMDVICLHTYTHGSDPFLITDETKMAPPFHNYHYNFRAYCDFLINTPQELSHLPVIITETDQVEPWVNRNLGWVKEAYEEINFWNNTVENQKIHCLCLYRSSRDDQWSFADKPQVQTDFREAVARGYRVPSNIIIDRPPTNPPIDPPTEEIPVVDTDRSIDPILIARGVTFDFVEPPRGTGYWKITNAIHLNEQEADAVGPNHHILGNVIKNGQEAEDVLFRVTWPSGFTHIKSKGRQSIANYNYDYPMSSSLNEYSIWVDDGNPSDRAMGIGMGENGNPSIHTSTWIDWQWIISDGGLPVPPIPPIEPPITPPSFETRLTHPLPQSQITQHFYQNPDDYARFSMPGHNGTDLGGKPQGTPVLSVADGIVSWSDFDPGYGFYVRVKHLQDDMMCYVMYCHLQRMGVEEGTRIEAGYEIGFLGSTGNSSGPHLHIEVRLMNKDGTYREGTPMTKGRVDPETFFAERGLKL